MKYAASQEHLQKLLQFVKIQDWHNSYTFFYNQLKREIRIFVGKRILFIPKRINPSPGNRKNREMKELEFMFYDFCILIICTLIVQD